MANHPKQAFFDIALIGLGAANSLLVLQLHRQGLLKGLSVAVIDPAGGPSLERTFCFWSTTDEVSRLGLVDLVDHSWDTISMPGITEERIHPVRYHHIKGMLLAEQAWTVLKSVNAVFIHDRLETEPVIQHDGYLLPLDTRQVVSKRVFDSRPPRFQKPGELQTHLLQSFIGWQVNASQAVFDSSQMVLMDFHVPQQENTQFIYILPFSPHSALIELTRFGRSKLTLEEATPILDDYISRLGTQVEITDREEGVIPMSSADIHTKDYGQDWIHMGARAGMLKSTTGYAFHAMADDAVRVSQNIASSTITQRSKKVPRFAFYDRLLLKILDRSPELGKHIFQSLFKHTSVSTVLRFLNERSGAIDEFRIFSGLPFMPFAQAALNEVAVRIRSLPTAVFGVVLTALFLLFAQAGIPEVSWSILGFGFLTAGLTHGALDHLTDARVSDTKSLLRFVTGYLLKGGLLGLTWIFLPDLALFLFILYSAWHFGQSDFKEWSMKENGSAFLWGLVVLSSPLLMHWDETLWVLGQIEGLESLPVLMDTDKSIVEGIAIGILLTGLTLALLSRSKMMLLTLSYILLCTWLPLLISFGIYFVAQHSLNGWRHLQKGLKKDYKSLWIQSLPFSIAGALIILLFILGGTTDHVGVFFILLSCISIPHVLSMHHFYGRVAGKLTQSVRPAATP